MKENTDNNGIQVNTNIIEKSCVCLNEAAERCHDSKNQ